ncbi:MAG TPA: hypothetical protein VHL09_11760 [Dehalococcoidia bacterium]|nr:hypothetical protein [Dehalococcoidia bacterium]
MADQPLLLAVQANVTPEGERAFNDWYHTHVPHLLEVPGYRWGRRYRSVFGPVKYLAIYEIVDRTWLPRLLGPDVSARPDIVNSEFAQWEKLSGLTDTAINVYEQIYGLPFTPTLMDRDCLLSFVTSDCRPEVEREFNAWYDESHVPNLLKVPGYISGMRFRLVEDPALDHLKMGPRYLALYEIQSEASLPHLTPSDAMSPEARAEFQNFQTLGVPLLAGDIGWNIYKPIAKHWKNED